MSELISCLGEWVVSYLVIASVLAAAIIPLTYVATRVGTLRSAVHRHLLWSCCLLAIVVLPPLRIQGWGPILKVLPAQASAVQQSPVVLPTMPTRTPGSAIRPMPDMSAEPNTPVVTHSPVDQTGSATTPVSAAASHDATGPSLTWQAMLAMAWLAGVMLLMARLVFAWRRLAMLCTSAKPVPPELLDRLDIPTTSQAAVLVSGELAAPVCIGIARPSILLPQAMVQQGDADELAMVLAHEFAHVQRRDCLVNLLQRAFEAIFFFHPLAWMASRQLTQAREQVCDNHVLIKGASAMNYANLLCRTVERTPRTAVSAVALFEGGLVQRLRNLKAATRSPLTGLGLFRRIGYGTCVLAVFACLAVVRLEARAATPQSQPAGKSATTEPAEFTVTTTVGADGRYVDKIDFPFRDDPAVIGLWTMVDTVKDVSSFKPGQKQWKGDLFCKALAFWPNGRMQVGGTWTKGLVISPGDKTAMKYTIKAINGADYMFMEFKGGDYIVRHQKPLYWVLKKENSDPKATIARVVDKIDYPFKDDPAVIGVWKSVDFVHEMADFKPGQKQWKDDLYLKEMVFLPNGRMSPSWASWTKGLVLHPGDKTASKYVIKTIDGVQYMFFEWKSGDYTIAGILDVPYYILKKESSDIGEVGKAWANLPSDDQWRREFPAKLAKLDINTADLEQVKKVFGQPAGYGWKKKYAGDTAAKDLPKWFEMEYPDGFSIYMVDGGKKIYELRYSKPGYFFEGKLQVGSSLADVLKVVGQPKETLDGAPIEFKDGVLYKNIKDKRFPGWSNVGYYGRSDKCVRFFFADDKVSALYVTSKTAQPWGGPTTTRPATRPTTRP